MDSRKRPHQEISQPEIQQQESNQTDLSTSSEPDSERNSENRETSENGSKSSHETLTYQHRISTVSNLLQCITKTVPSEYDLANLTLLCFPLFLCFELWVFQTNPKRYTPIVESTENKLREILKSQTQNGMSKIPASEFVRDRIEPLFHYTTQDLPNTEPTTPPRKKTKIQKVELTPKTQSFVGFCNLPVELQLHVLKFVDSSEWRNCVLVNKSFQSLFYESRESVTFSSKLTKLQLHHVFNKCPRLKSIRFNTGGNSEFIISGPDIEMLPRKVQELKLPTIMGLNSSALFRLSGLNLNSLELEGLEVNELVLTQLLSRPKVQWLRLGFSNANIRSKNFVQLLLACDLSRLEILDISGLDLSKEELKTLLNYPWKALKDINLSGNFLDKEIVEELCSKLGQQLRVLRLSVCLIDHNDVKVICKAMPQLEILELGYSRVNPSSSTMAHLVELKNLRKLQLRGWPIVTAHVIYLLSNLSLEELDVQYCGGVHQKNYDRALFSSDTKVILSNHENESLLEAQLKDILQFAKRLQTLPLCRLFFPPFSRAQHREHFITAFRKTMKLIDLGWKKYLVSHQTRVPPCCPTLSKSPTDQNSREEAELNGVGPNVFLP